MRLKQATAVYKFLFSSSRRSYRESGSVSLMSPQSTPVSPPQRVWLLTEQVCGVYADETLFASQMSISVQQVPYWPVPAFGSLSEGTQSSKLASPDRGVCIYKCAHMYTGRDRRARVWVNGCKEKELGL